MTAPNIILLILDDAVCEQLQRMPQLMKLGVSGVIFMNAFANTALCQPARATYLTGQYSHNNGIIGNQTVVSTLDHTTMLAARLQLAGYSTCQVGKYLNAWVLTDPIPAGWNEWHYTTPQQYYGFSINDNGVVTTVGSALGDYHTTVCNSRALAFIASATQPFFMQVSYFAPHFDLPTTDFLNATPASFYAGVIPSSKLAPRPSNYNAVMGTPPAYMAHAPMDAPKISAVDAFWRGSTEMLFSVDRSIQDISAALVAAGKTNTIIIVTSDHGYFRGEGRNPAQKIAPYLPALRIPMIVSGPPGLVAQSATCSRLVTQVDIAPTIYALSGATAAGSRPVDGASLTSLMLNPNGASVRNNLLMEWLGTPGTTGWSVTIPTYRSLLSPPYLYSAYDTGEKELFDTDADPFQLTNLAGVPAYATVQANLASLLSSSQSCVGGACVI